jgi:hypothetical protein
MHTSSTPTLSLIIPTRERAAYLGHSIRTCVENDYAGLEILILDNASTDDTRRVVAGFDDPRIRYVRNDTRLSMRDNFEKGLELSTGEIVCFVGDDDGVFPFTVRAVIELFRDHDIEAIAAARAHYFWPDLVSGRRNMALIPRAEGMSVLDSRIELKQVLTDCDYYKLPCLYHGFVRRSLVERVRQRQGRMFLSSQVDMYSAISLSMEGVRFARSLSPLIVNGASSRSNGASHFGGGTATEKTMWKREDDIGFLPGFADSLTVGSLILESGLRYCAANAGSLADLMNPADIRRAVVREVEARRAAGRPEGDSKALEALVAQLAGAGSERTKGDAPAAKSLRLVRSYLNACPVDMQALGVVDVHGAAHAMQTRLSSGRTGLFHRPLEQMRSAMRIARG